jgi:hypothetical protein
MAGSRMEEILAAQLTAANMFNKQLLVQVETLSATVKSMEGTIASLQEALLQKDESLVKSGNKIRGISKLISNKSEKQSRTATANSIRGSKTKSRLESP